ncbi:MAG: bifunctional DNA primase/polymerase [Phycisphaeraceae bacterium]|nr:bifunctional DNA primase/polymerase [Phycisphaeraceae bacterium]
MSTINTTSAAAAADSPDNATLSEALRLAELGFYVFPCKPGAKIPLTKNGFKSATCDPDQIRAWWTRCPDANLAVATEGFLALDIDGAENPYLADEARAASVSAFPQSRTPRGGRHFLMAQPVGRPVRNSAGQLAEHVDIRANGGYIVVAPSVVGGKAYQWETPLLIGADSLPPMPDWLEAALDSLKSGKRKRRGGPIPEGRRNSELTSRAGRMRRAGLDESQIAEQLLQMNRGECQPPLEEEEVRKIAASAKRYESDAAAATARIIVAPDEARVTDEALAAMVADPDIYSRGTRLVRVVRAGLGSKSLQGGLVITDLPIASLREKMSRRIEFVKIGPEGEVIVVHPPDWCVKQADSRAQWPEFRELVAISDVPVLRPDGSVHQSAGYDPVTGVLYAPTCEFPLVPDSPTVDDVIEATTHMVELVCDFRFVEPCHRSAFFAALLSVVGRFAFDGPAPMFVFDANVRGAGKTLLAFVAATIAIGPGVGTSGYVESDEEMRKQITSKLIEGHRLVILDNLPGRVGCPSLDRVLTTTTWTDRILGKSESATLPATAVWFATGNNVVLMADTARRVVPIRIEVLDENPEDRAGFKHPDLLRFVRENRATLLCACLTWLSAYIRAGKPSLGLQPFGSFEGWSDTIRCAVVHAGFEDPCAGRAQLAEDSDRARDELFGVLDGLRKFDPRDRGIVVADMLASLYSTSTEAPDDLTVRLRAAIEAAVGSRPGQAPTARQVGNFFRANRKRVVAGMHLDNDSSEKSSRGTVWHVRRNEVPPV